MGQQHRSDDDATPGVSLGVLPEAEPKVICKVAEVDAYLVKIVALTELRFLAVVQRHDLCEAEHGEQEVLEES